MFNMIDAVLAPFVMIFALGLVSFFVKSLRHSEELSERSVARQVRLRSLGILVLFLGALSGLLVATTSDPDDLASTAFARSRFSDHEAILIGGKAAVYATELREWFAGLWHGRMLALMIFLVCALVCLACFFLAHPLLISPDPASDTQPRDRRNVSNEL